MATSGDFKLAIDKATFVHAMGYRTIGAMRFESSPEEVPHEVLIQN